MDYAKIAESVMIPDGPPKKRGVPLGFRFPGPRFENKYIGRAEELGYSQDGWRPAKLTYTHDALIDVIIANPTLSKKELGERFGRSASWMSRVIGSDAFQGALAKRRDELTDPFLLATIEERLTGVAMQSLDIISEKLEQTQNLDTAMKALEVSAKALGFGARTGNTAAQQTNFVIQLPGKSPDSSSWTADHAVVEQKG